MGLGPVQELLFFIKFTDIFTVFALATLLFACRSEKRPHFSLRVAAMLVPILLLCQLFARTYGGALALEIAYSAILITLMIAGLLFCYKENIWNMLFYFGSGFMTWYIADRSILIAASLCRLSPALKPYFVENTVPHVLLYCATMAAVYAVVYATAGRTMRRLEGNQIPAQNTSLLLLVVCTLTPIFYFASSLIEEYSLPFYTLLNLGEILYYVSMLVVQIVILKFAKEKTEYSTLQTLWVEQQKQYFLVKENIEAINIKCHDLKHQIRHLRDARQIDRAYLDELENSISIYSSAVRTGNETLDVVLTDKRLHCAANGIQFTCMADGAKLNFMEVMDVFSLFGNAVDNAIECESALAPEQRFIHLSVRSVNQLLLIHIENYFEGTLTISGGLPVTTKGNKDYHGYGIRSIQHIAKKYGGDLSISSGDGLFQLDIMIPIPAETAILASATQCGHVED